MSNAGSRVQGSAVPDARSTDQLPLPAMVGEVDSDPLTLLHPRDWERLLASGVHHSP